MNDKPIAAGKSSFDLIDFAKLKDLLEIKPGITFLDVACGRGAYCLKASDIIGSTGTVYAVDLWEEGIQELKAQAAEVNALNINAFVGDAGLEMFLGELATARDHKLGLPIVVFVDEQLGLIELKQRMSQMPNLGVEFPGTDFTAVAEAMGGAGTTCHTRDALESAITDAFKRDTFTVISAVIGRNAYDGRI